MYDYENERKRNYTKSYWRGAQMASSHQACAFETTAKKINDSV